ncbi:hypothetical protein IMG5_180810 [Ichthyophthirius multifiliis]|uniref:Uncharacterized protein n=1 Tax=Ichthyophthirius multifiliis TaxID=5932 RepID=G0R2R9_ICHMU|nr:hypothetical protein IMG5_180810 [Ichthyophthirius multifiliis]EGR28241.1 hypothetical protein IMG5_180810 [Ichthyophthirius multifiliis]|eukprot:XP_004027586.1 hypothetical protein IMG5_180810 [Ichthyophthirius multifiliis]
MLNSIIILFICMIKFSLQNLQHIQFTWQQQILFVMFLKTFWRNAIIYTIIIKIRWYLYTFIWQSLIFLTIFDSISPKKDTIKSPTRDDIATCQVRQCFHPLYECFQDKNCEKELIEMEHKYEQDPSQYETLVSQLKASELKELFSCYKKKCQVESYIQHCGKEDVYIKQCFRNKDCQKENKAYFDNYNTCSNRKYQACEGLQGEKQLQCISQEVIWCASDGLTDLKGELASAFFCL